jgi:hypothetical protein
MMPELREDRRKEITTAKKAEQNANVTLPFTVVTLADGTRLAGQLADDAIAADSSLTGTQGIEFSGGKNSADKLDKTYRLTEAVASLDPSVTAVEFLDANEEPVILSFSDALSVQMAIGKILKDSKFREARLHKEIAAVTGNTPEEVEAALNAIAW